MHLVVMEVKTNATNVPSKDKQTGEWIIKGKILVNSDRFLIRECSEGNNICIAIAEGYNFYVLGSFQEITDQIGKVKTLSNVTNKE